MTKTIAVFLALTGLVLTTARPANAQGQSQPESKWLLNVNLGAQTQSRDYALRNSYPLYDEFATFDVGQHVGKGLIFDVSAGRDRPVWRKLLIMGGVSIFHDTHDASFTASIPHPLFFDQPKTTSATVPRLKHTEVGLHFSGVWPIPVTEKIDVSFFAGPSILVGKKDVVATVAVPDGTQDAEPVVVSQSKAHIGFNIGADASYRLTPRYSLGWFLRYAGGHVNLESITNLKIGGVQTGGGIRIRF